MSNILVISLILFNYFPPHTGSVQQFVTPKEGTYKIECWGASGADNAKELSGGRGGYTKGIIYLSKNIELYLFVGQSPDRNSRVGGWNGGGNGKYIIQDGNAGGGSTDIRLVNGAWNDFISLKSRIMVAAGGGGSGKDINGIGGSGGGIYGYDGEDYSGWTTGDYYYTGAGASQISGGDTKNTTDYVSSDVNSGLLINSELNKGGFGYGGTDGDLVYGGSGGGGGYYGGGASNRGHGGGGGGASFISGYTGCNAIDKSSISTNIKHTGYPNHCSGYVFTNSVMIAGNATMPSLTGGTETGHTGNGYCIILWIP